MGLFQFLSVAMVAGMVIAITAILKDYLVECARSRRGTRALQTELQALQARLQELQREEEMLRRLKQ